MKRVLSTVFAVLVLSSLSAQEVPASLQSQTWLNHFAQEILPYWDSTEALGVPYGNYPTHRGRDGRLVEETRRWPRMMGRQILFILWPSCSPARPSTSSTPRPGLTG
jgi:hypothetical protein